MTDEQKAPKRKKPPSKGPPITPVAPSAPLPQSPPAVPPQLAAMLGAQPISAIVAQSSTQLWQGQFPPPDAIERYEKTLPGSFDRIIRMTEKRIDAEIAAGQENRAAQRNDVMRGHYLGSVVTIFALICGVVCVVLHAGWGETAAFLAVPVMAVARSLVESWRAPRHHQPSAAVTTPTGPNPPTSVAKREGSSQDGGAAKRP